MRAIEGLAERIGWDSPHLASLRYAHETLIKAMHDGDDDGD